MNKIVEFARSRRVSLPGVLILPLLTAMLLAQTAGNWTQESPPASPSARDLHSMVYDAAHGQVVLFGGVFPGNSDPRVSNFLGDTWIWDGTNWNQKSPQTSPPARGYCLMAYDAAHQQVVLFGGFSSGPPFVAGTTWGDTDR